MDRRSFLKTAALTAVGVSVGLSPELEADPEFQETVRYIKTHDSYEELRELILQAHREDLERAFLFGTTEPERTTEGIIPWLERKLEEHESRS